MFPDASSGLTYFQRAGHVPVPPPPGCFTPWHCMENLGREGALAQSLGVEVVLVVAGGGTIIFSPEMLLTQQKSETNYLI